MTSHDDESVHRYPELRSLIAIREAGWRFLPHFDEQRNIVLLDGFCPRAGYTDALRVRDRDDALGLRLQRDDGGVVWQRHGTLPEVVNDLLALPEPGDPLAPTLVRAPVSRLWTP